MLQVHWNILKQESENTGIIHSIKLNKAIMSIYPTSQIVFQGSQRFLGWKAFWRLPTKYVLLQVSSVEVAWKVVIVISLFAALCGSRKYPYPHHWGNWKFRRGGRVKDPGNSEGEGGYMINYFPEVLWFNTDLSVDLAVQKSFLAY